MHIGLIFHLDQVYIDVVHGEKLACFIKQIILNSEKIYNRDIVQTLLEIIPFYPVGTAIKVIDIVDPHLVGYSGVVAKVNEENINNPVIILTKNRQQKKIKPMIIDTSKFSKVELQLIL